MFVSALIFKLIAAVKYFNLKWMYTITVLKIIFSVKIIIFFVVLLLILNIFWRVKKINTYLVE